MAKWKKDAVSGQSGRRKQAPAKPHAPTDPHTNNQYPANLYHAMLHPVLPYAIRGAIWYQGESNAGRAYQYRTLFPLMINAWRAGWQEGDFPFYFVQLASFMARAGPGRRPG